MKRVNYHVTDEQRERLKTLAEATGRPVAELVRVAVDAYLDKEEKRRSRKESR